MLSTERQRLKQIESLLQIVPRRIYPKQVTRSFIGRNMFATSRTIILQALRLSCAACSLMLWRRADGVGPGYWFTYSTWNDG